MFTFPYGPTRMPDVCSDHRNVRPAVEYFGTSDPAIWSMLGNPCSMMGNLHKTTAAIGGPFSAVIVCL